MKRWKKIILWTMAVTTVLVGGTILALLLLLRHSAGFRQSMLGKVASSLQESTGARFQAGDFSLQLSNRSLDLYNVVIHGKETDPSRPLLQADHVQIGLTIDSIVNREWHVRYLVIDHPVARLDVNNAGENNLPPSPPQDVSSGSRNIFDLAIRDLKVVRGEIYYNDRKTPLTAEIHDLKANGNYVPGQNKYSGTLSYTSGKIIYGAYAPVEHNLQASFGLTPKLLTLEKVELSTGRSRAELSGSVSDYTSPNMRAEGSYEVIVATGDLQRILKDPSIPTGTVRLAGQVKYQAQPGRPLLETVSVAGSLNSAALAVRRPGLETEVRGLYARYNVAHGNVELDDIHATVMGGTLAGKLTIRDIAGARIGQLQASTKDISLDEAQVATHQKSMEQAHLSGKVNADVNAHWAKTLNNLMARADATLQARLGSPATPLDGVIHAEFNAAHKELALTKSYLRTPHTTINLDGEVSNRSQLQAQLRSSDLHELELLSAALRKAGPGPSPQPFGLYGTGNLTATISGTTNAPQIKGQLEARNLRVKGSSWKLVRTAFTADPSQITLSNGDLEAQIQGRITFSAQAVLKNWAYLPDNPVEVKLSASQISVADLARLANQSYQAEGTLGLNVSFHGSQLNPVGQGTITIANASFANESIQNIQLKFQGDGNQVNGNLLVQMSAGTARADVNYLPRSQEYRASLQAQNFRLEKLKTVQAHNMQLVGGVNLTASGAGALNDPQLQATLEARQLRMKKQMIEHVKLQTTVKNHVATIALDSAIVQTSVKANGTIGMAAPYPVDIRLDTGRIDLQPLLALYAPTQASDLTGQTELHATVRGPLAQKNRVEAHIEVPNLSLNYRQFQLAAAKPVQLDYRDGTLTLQPASIRGTGTTIDAQAVVPITTQGKPSLLVKGNIDLKIAELLAPGLTSSGQLQLDVDSSRYAAGDDVNGQIKLVDANLHSVDSPMGLEHANGVINVTQTRMEIERLEGQVGGGTIGVTGAIAYKSTAQFQLGLTAKNVRVRYPDGVRSILDSTLTLTGSARTSTLGGQVRIESVSFTPDFDLATFVAQFNEESGDTGAPDSFLHRVKLDMNVQSTSQMNLASSQVSLRGDANLHVVGTAAVPVVLGRANLTGGEFFVANNRYELRSGTVDFVNAVHTEPVLNLQLLTTIDQYNITLGVHGPLTRLETNYTSDPSLPPVDIINLIARGRTVESAAANPNPSGTLGAQAVLASTLSNQVTGRIAKLAGLSQFQIDPNLGNENGRNPGARIAIQQRVTSNLLVTYATDVTSTGRQAVQIEYKFNQRWSVTGTRDQNGGFGMDGKYRKDF